MTRPTLAARRVGAAAAALALGFGLVACGGDGEDAAGAVNTAPPAPETQAVEPTDTAPAETETETSAVPDPEAFCGQLDLGKLARLTGYESLSVEEAGSPNGLHWIKCSLEGPEDSYGLGDQVGVFFDRVGNLATFMDQGLEVYGDPFDYATRAFVRREHDTAMFVQAHALESVGSSDGVSVEWTSVDEIPIDDGQLAELLDYLREVLGTWE